ncbi:MAG: hypothetical protein C4332_14200 [Meiothermus sp.]
MRGKSQGGFRLGLVLGLLALSWALSAQSGVPSVGGKYHGLTWGVYQAGRVEFVWPAQAKLLGARWREPSVVVGFRAAAPLAKVFANRDQQLAAQGFQRTDMKQGEGEASATYARANHTLLLQVERLEGGAYRATFDLSGVREGN